MRLPQSACRTASFFSTSSSRNKGIMPDTENPDKAAPESVSRYTPVDMTESEYHEIADEFMERLLVLCEEAQEERDDLDVEYSVSPPIPLHNLPPFNHQVKKLTYKTTRPAS